MLKVTCAHEEGDIRINTWNGVPNSIIYAFLPHLPYLYPGDFYF